MATELLSRTLSQPAVRLPRPVRIGAMALALIGFGATAAIAGSPAALPDSAPKLARPPVAARASLEAAKAAALRRQGRLKLVRSWGYQLAGISLPDLAAAPYDLLVVDATTGLASGAPMRREDIARIARKPDGSKRLILGYLSIGEAEDYRPYFDDEYMKEEAPDWLMSENPHWKGNRLIRFCSSGWQSTIIGTASLGDVYSETELSPLGRLVDLGLDGVYLDRVDIFHEVAKACPNARAEMIGFVSRLAEAARRKHPDFMVVIQNAEDLADDPAVLGLIDGEAKESLFYGDDFGQRPNSAGSVEASLAHLDRIKAGGRIVLVVDYLKDKAASADMQRKAEARGFIPYVAPRKLDQLWLPGRNF